MVNFKSATRSWILLFICHLKLLLDLNFLKLDRNARANGSVGYDTVKQIRLRNSKQLKAILTPQIQSNTGVSLFLSSQNHLISIAYG
jgi:hypothetical protein